MRNPVIWNQREEVDWLKYSVQPPLGLIVGDYYVARREFGAPPGVRGHQGSLEVVCEAGEIRFVEFNEIAMDAYYNQYFSSIDKRRSDYGIWQASKPRQAAAGVVLADGLRHVEAQIMARQSLLGDFDLLTGASGSMKNMLPMAAELAEQIARPSGARYYGIAEAFGYGLTGWLRVVVENGRMTACRYDEILADHQAQIRYPELRQYYRQSKYHSPCYQDPFPPGWDRHAWNLSFRALMDMLEQRALAAQSLDVVDDLPYAQGKNLGPLWDREGPGAEPATNVDAIRYPAWDNYLRLAEKLTAALPAQLGRRA